MCNPKSSSAHSLLMTKFASHALYTDPSICGKSELYFGFKAASHSYKAILECIARSSKKKNIQLLNVNSKSK